MNKITIVGMGYVGLTTGACFADLGNQVIGIDTDVSRIAELHAGRLPIYEPGLAEMVQRNTAAGRLSFATDYRVGLTASNFVFLCVNTPSGVDGEADLHALRGAVRSIAENAQHDLIVIDKSTVPVGTGDLVKGILEHVNPGLNWRVVSNPEFLREGTAIHDFLNPDRVILGSDDRAAAEAVAALYGPLNCPVLLTRVRNAEMIKYASNAFLATKISFINEIAAICDQTEADVTEVARGMGLDKRIGSSFLDAGLGFGGSCFPKDVRALAHLAAIHGTHPQLLRSVLEINHDQRLAVVQRIRDALGTLDGAVIAILGLSFKPNTDDLRESPALEIARLLQNEGAEVRAYDPVAMPGARSTLPQVTYCSTAAEAAAGADTLLIATEWNEFKQLNLATIQPVMRTAVLVDGRNIFNPLTVRAQGFHYIGIGRGVPRDEAPVGLLKNNDSERRSMVRQTRT